MKNSTIKILFLFVLVGFFSLGCSSKSKRQMNFESEAVAGDTAMASESYEDSYEESDELAEEASYSPAPVMSQSRSAPLKKEGQTATRSVRANRKIYYEGMVRLEVTNPEETLEGVVKSVKDLGGYVETRNKSRVVVRVPVKKFRGVYQEVLGMGEVLERSITAQDITDRYQDMEMRKRHLKLSLDKFYSLLKVAKSSSEKIAILKQITQLKEKLRYMEIALAELAKMAKYSKLTVSAENRKRRLASTGVRNMRAFHWIDQLNPNARSLAKGGSKIDIQVPPEFVRLKKKRHWESQTSGKSTFWVSRQKNKLNANADFWLEAMEARLKSRFSSVKRYDENGVKGLRLEDGVGRRYSYHVQILTTEDNIFLFESSFPTTAEEEKHLNSVRKAVMTYSGEVKDAI